MMQTYQFTLIVGGPDLQSDELAEEIFEAGCDDVLIGVSDSIQYADVDRKAPSLEEAILSAIFDIERVEGAVVVRIADAGLVTMADVAERTGRTRESVRLLVSGRRGPGGFPPPVTDPRGRYRLWRWTDVERWFSVVFGEYQGGEGPDIEAIINAGLELRHLSHRSNAEQRALLRELVGL